MTATSSTPATLPEVDTNDFRLAVEPLGDTQALVAVTGELDLATVPALRGALTGAVERGASALVVDLTGVTFVDSVGVGAILHSKRRLGENGRLAVVVAPSTYARVIFDVVGADSVVAVFEDRKAAVAFVTS
jgi:anti-sigma B factor antagonist